MRAAPVPCLGAHVPAQIRPPPHEATQAPPIRSEEPKLKLAIARLPQLLPRLLEWVEGRRDAITVEAPLLAREVVDQGESL